MSLIRTVLLFVRGMLRNRTELAAENLAMRQQLAVLREKVERPPTQGEIEFEARKPKRQLAAWTKINERLGARLSVLLNLDRPPIRKERGGHAICCFKSIQTR